MTISIDQAAFAAETLKALGHPLRLRLVAALCEGDRTVTDLVNLTGARPATVSQQLRILRMRGLVRSRRSGGFATYHVADPGLCDLIRCIGRCPSFTAP